MNKEIKLLQQLISHPSYSGHEEKTADCLEVYLTEHGIPTFRKKNNVWALNQFFTPDKPTILLNSHHDTVTPNSGYTNDPFDAKIEDGKLYGLGSNDAGGSLVALLSTFAHFYSKKELKYNLIVAVTAEEENSGSNGIRSILSELPNIDFAIVGEPTEMQMAIAEKGLLVIDAVATGKAGHAAHSNTINPISIAVEDIQLLSNYCFEKTSPLLGSVKITCSQISAGVMHNVVPETCTYILDIRTNEFYSNQEVFECLQKVTRAHLKPRSFHLNSSSIPLEHPIVEAAKKLNLPLYGSPTLSDQTNLTCPSVKIGPGSSLRSHQANEFIELAEIELGIKIYKELLNKVIL